MGTVETPSPPRPLSRSGIPAVGASNDMTIRPRPFHLAVYSDARDRGGAEMTLVQLLAGLPDDIRVSVVAVDENVGTYIGDHRPGAEVHLIDPIGSRRDLRAMRAHRRLFRSLDADLIQFNLTMGSSCQWAMLVTATMRGCKERVSTTLLPINQG